MKRSGFLALLLILGGRPAAAESPPPSGLAVLMPIFDARSVDIHTAGSFRQALQRAAAASGQKTLDLAEADRLLALDDLSCTSAPCLTERARLLQVQTLLGGRLERQAKQQTWVLFLWVFDASQGMTSATIEDRCVACTRDAALGFAEGMTRRLLERRAIQQGGRIEVRSRPTGAMVRIDGQAMGATDMTFGVTPGWHEVVVEHPELGLERRRVEVKPGERTLVTTDLALRPERRAMGETGPSRLGVWKWVTLAVGLGAMGAGTALLALDGKETCSREIESYTCDKVYETMTPGIALVTAGTLALGGSLTLFILDARSEQRRARATVGPWMGPGSGGLTATVGF